MFRTWYINLKSNYSIYRDRDSPFSERQKDTASTSSPLCLESRKVIYGTWNSERKTLQWKSFPTCVTLWISPCRNSLTRSRKRLSPKPPNQADISSNSFPAQIPGCFSGFYDNKMNIVLSPQFLSAKTPKVSWGKPCFQHNRATKLPLPALSSALPVPQLPCSYATPFRPHSWPPWLHHNYAHTSYPRELHNSLILSKKHPLPRQVRVPVFDISYRVVRHTINTMIPIPRRTARTMPYFLKNSDMSMILFIL